MWSQNSMYFELWTFLSWALPLHFFDVFFWLLYCYPRATASNTTTFANVIENCTRIVCNSFYRMKERLLRKCETNNHLTEYLLTSCCWPNQQMKCIFRIIFIFFANKSIINYKISLSASSFIKIDFHLL